jgi:hypothetical protein
MEKYPWNPSPIHPECPTAHPPKISSGKHSRRVDQESVCLVHGKEEVLQVELGSGVVLGAELVAAICEEEHPYKQKVKRLRKATDKVLIANTYIHKHS